MKFATGENPKRCYGPDKKSPMTRMGVAAVMRGALYKAKVYSCLLYTSRPFGRVGML